MLQLSSTRAQMDLVLELAEKGGAWSGHLVYCTDLFSSTTAERLVGHLQVNSMHFFAYEQHYQNSSQRVCWLSNF